MYQINLNKINDLARNDPRALIAMGEAEYAEKITAAAMFIRANADRKPIVLLSGPSGSGKTTTSKLLQRRLHQLGINTHTISMDDYFTTRTEENSPRDEDGKIDLESPLCLDIPLFKAHLTALSEGQEVKIPSFDFPNQCRSDEVHPLQVGKDEVAIIEGIHALNDMVTGDVSMRATKLYVSVASALYEENREVFGSKSFRFLRRSERDKNFRNTPVAATLEQWISVRRGERKYIKPFKVNADIAIDSAIDYEVNAMLPTLEGEIKRLDPQAMERASLSQLYDCLDKIVPVETALIPPESLLREFLGGSTGLGN